LSSYSSWARLELLAGLLQEVLLLSLSLSIIIDAINKFINPNHVEDPSAMIYLGAAGACIGLLGLFLFRGYHHDHNIGDEIVEQKKNDFVQSVYNTIRNLDVNNGHIEQTLTDQKTVLITPTLVVTEPSLLNIHEQSQKQQQLVLPSLNDTYTNSFVISDKTGKIQEERFDDNNMSEQQLRVPDGQSIGFNRMRRKSGESIMSSTIELNEDKTGLEDHFEESRVYATLHALCLHSLVNIDQLKKRDFFYIN
jgi:hypothetical protein